MTEVGIVGYGVYVPRHYIFSNAIDQRAAQLGLSKKALALWDEDSVTMGVQAAQQALVLSGIKPQEVGALYIGSESPAYAVNPSSTIVADVLGMGHDYQAVDLQFACKAATAGLQMIASQVSHGHIGLGLIIGSDKSQAKQGDALEWSAGAAAAALLVGSRRVLAKIVMSASYTSDTPDFWRRESQAHPLHGGRFTGKPAYFAHVTAAASKVMKKTALAPSDFAHVVFHMPNGVFPIHVGEQLGFSRSQMATGMTVYEVGNPYSASSLLGLTAVLEKAKPGELILMASYGSGAGSDAFVFQVTDLIDSYKRGEVSEWLSRRKEVSLQDYLQHERWQ